MLIINLFEERLSFLQSNFNLFDFLDSVDFGSYIVDVDRRILFWSHMAQEITGYWQEEVTGSKCKDQILQHQDRNGIELCNTDLCPLFRTILSGKSTILPFSVLALSKSKKRIPMNVITFPIKLNGEIFGAIEFFSKADNETKDLQIALKIQESLIPSDLPKEIKVFYHPSNIIGGDMIYVKNNWIALIDVSGHGISSALVSTTVRVMLSEILEPELDIRLLGNILENKFTELGKMEMYFTGIFVKKEGNRLLLKRFGHPGPIIVKNQSVKEIMTDIVDFPIGWGMAHNEAVFEIELKKGETLFLLSDGITDLQTGEKELGYEGLQNILKSELDLKKIFVAAMTLCIDNIQKDDITLISISCSE